MTAHEKDVADIGRRIRGLCSDWIERTKRVLPVGDKECRQLFEQWSEALSMMQKHAGDPRAGEYMLATLALLGDALEARGVKTF